MKIGYARVSTTDQSLDLQIDALERAGCDRIFQDVGLSGADSERPGLCEALNSLRGGDVFTVWRMDRMARSVRDLCDNLAAFDNRGIGLRSLCEYGIDTTSPMGRLIFHIMAAVAEFERAIIIERTRAGIEIAKANGTQFGRPMALDGEMLREALFLIGEGMKVPAAATHLGVGRSTLYRHMADIRPAFAGDVSEYTTHPGA